MTTPVKKVPIHLQSSQNRLLIKNGSVVNEDGVQKVDIFIEETQIKQLGNHLIIPGGTRVIDATDKFVIPGGVDANVHLHKPHGKGITQTVDDFYQGTRAALVGGTTTVIDCVHPDDDESLIEAYNKWRGWAEDRACCNYALRLALPPGAAPLTEDTKREMEELTGEEYGVNTFDVPMGGTFASPEALMEAFGHCRRIGALAQVRAESAELVAREEKALLARGITGPEGFAMAHSEMAEEEATMRAVTLANQTSCPLYVSPVMSSSAAEVIRRKRAKGIVVFGETTPAALACDGAEYWNSCWRHAAGFVCSPPIRKGQKDEMVELVTAGAEAGLNVIASDHTTFNASQKALGSSDFTKIPVGVNGVEARMSVLWERAVHSGKMDPTKFVSLTSATPAKIFNMYPAKGRIEVGAEADIVIWNPNATKTFSAKSHQLKVDFNIFEGLTCHGVAETVICSGKVMVDDGQLRIMQGFGRFLPIAPFSSHVYDLVREKEMADAAPRAVERDQEEMTINGSSGDIPPPTPPKTNQAVPAPSQLESHFDLRSHPDPDASQQGPNRSTVRVRLPPGGRSSGGFW